MRFASADPGCNEILEEIRRAFPGQPIAHGIDHKGPYARIGDFEARARDCTTALRTALTRARDANA